MGEFLSLQTHKEQDVEFNEEQEWRKAVIADLRMLLNRSDSFFTIFFFWNLIMTVACMVSGILVARLYAIQ